MALKLDFRKVLRAIAAAVQEDNARRLVTGQTVAGGRVAPRKAEAKAKGRARRVRIFGERLSLRELAGAVGVRTGAMLRDLTRRANAKIGRVRFKIVPSPDQILKWRVFNAGGKRQPARPVSGIDASRMSLAAEAIALEGRNQFVAAANRRRRS